MENQAKQSLAQKKDSNISIEKIQLCYKPTIIGSYSVRFLDRKNKINKQIEKSLIVDELGASTFLDWKSARESDIKITDLLNSTEHVIDKEIFFEPLSEFVNSKQEFKKLAKDLQDFLYYTQILKLKKNTELDIIQNPDESDRDFQIRLLQVAREQRDIEVDRLKKKYSKQLDKLENKISKLEFDLSSDESDYEARKREEIIGAGESVLSFFLGSRRTSTATTAARRRRLTSKAKMNISKTKKEIIEAKKDVKQLEEELKKEVEKIVEKYEKGIERLSYEEFKPKRSDITIKSVALAWKPIWLIRYKEKGLLQTTNLEA